MPIHNSGIADLFDEVADLLEIESENPFRVRAYRNASRVIRNWPSQLSEVVRAGHDLPKIPGIGKDLSDKIIEAVKTDKLSLLEQLKKKTPEGLLDLLKLPGIGPKRVRKLQEELKINSLQDLELALQKDNLKDLDGFGPKIEQKLRDELHRLAGLAPSERKRMFLAAAEETGEPLLAYLQAIPGVKQAVIAGSFRRCLATIGDLDFLVSSDKPSQVMKRFLEYEDVREVISKGETRSTVILRSHVQVDLRAVPNESYGAALHYFTGSKAHNIAIRSLGMKKGLKINEYGIFKGRSRVGGKTEAEVFESVGLPYIEPELRENQGEIEAARSGLLPDLMRLDQIRGDLHAHTLATDGRLSIKEMATAARKLGYDYLAITDHSRRLAMVRGLDSKRLAAQMLEIDRLNENLSGFHILKSIEVDILEDGSLDLPNSILSQLDFTVCSIHSHFELSPKKQTERILRAMDNPCFHIFGHPTGRLIGQRLPMDFDMEKVMSAAMERGCVLEINAQPERMDLSDVYCRLVKEMGAKVVISTDAHSDRDLTYMKFGVSQARRGWLEAKDILNTRSWKEIKRFFGKRNSSVAAA